MRRGSFLSSLLSVLLAAGPSTGCTAIGFAAGAAADRFQENVVKPAGGARDVETLQVGTAVELTLRDGRTVRGRFQGLDLTVTEARIPQYQASARDLAEKLGLPGPGPGARVALTRGAEATGELIGYGPDFVVFREREGKPPVVVSLDRIVRLAGADRRTITGPVLEELLRTAGVRLLARVRLEQADVTTLIPYEDVVGMGYVVSPSSGKETGLIVGAVLDVLYIAAMALCYRNCFY